LTGNGVQRTRIWRTLWMLKNIATVSGEMWWGNWYWKWLVVVGGGSDKTTEQHTGTIMEVTLNTEVIQINLRSLDDSTYSFQLFGMQENCILFGWCTISHVIRLSGLSEFQEEYFR
jgi:hypothetical protein